MIGSPTPSYKSIVSIEFGRESVKAVSAAKNGRGLKIKKTLDCPIDACLLTTDPDALGEALRMRMTETGMYDAHCMVSVPLQWVLKHRIEVPELSPDDVESYIRLQAERAFPFPLDELSISTSWFEAADGKRYASIHAVRLSQIEALRAVCKKAKLTPLSFTIGQPSEFNGQTSGHAVHLRQRDDGVDCQIIHNNELIGFRFFEADWSEGAHKGIPSLFRDIRVTLSELPLALQSSFGAIVVCGPREWADAFIQAAGPAASLMNMRLETAAPISPKPINVNGDAYWVGPIYHTANQFYLNQKSQVEFLPPRVNRFKQWASKISSRGSLVAGASATAVMVVVCAAFVYQYYTWSSLNSRWQSIRDQVDEVSVIQDNVRLFRPWFDESLPALSSLHTLVEAFPEAGSIWVQVVEIDQSRRVSFSGFAEDSHALLMLHETLKQDERVQYLTVEQMLGEPPIKFAFNFQWIGN